MKSTDQKRINCLCLAENIKAIIGNETYIGYMGRLNQRIDEEKANEKLMAGQIENIKRDTELFLKRMEEWRNSYEQLPWFVRMFKKFTCFNQKIQAWSFAFIDDAELAFLKRGMSLDEIESIYKRKICDNDEQISLLETKKCLAREKAEQLEKQKEEIRSKIETLRNEYSAFEKYKAAMPDSAFEQFDLCQFNDLLDRVRYAEFWLAVHYYESRWLIESNPISAKQKGKTFENVLDDMYHRLAMISPCMVMTFFMLPKQFYAYDGNDKKHYYMYNYIDLLIVDEAGQMSPEIAAASFSLAKKAIIVGDEEQIPPVWGTPRALDIAMAVSNGVIESRSDYCKLEENGLNCSQSSVMRVAALSCPYKKYKGSLFLSEHRRCYDEIIEYCNKLVYESKLEPKRGTFANDEKNCLKGVLPALGFKQVTAENSQRAAGSRQNKAEAEAIAVWLKERYEDILKCYMKEERLDKREVLGIITPFRGQSFLIRRYIKKMLSDYSDFIDVGTVHTFQGAERKVIIFSAVYGNKDGCWFINRSSNLMNVAVSRAKDSFLVFADKECLAGGEKTAAGLLKKMVFTNGEEI